VVPPTNVKDWVGAAASAVALAATFGSYPTHALSDEPPQKQWVLKLATIPFQAKFQLTVDDGKNADRSSGTLYLRPDGMLCVAVEKPLHQFLAFGRQELNIYYPDDHIVLRGKPKAGQLPPMVDALFLGYVDPSAVIPPTSKVLEQTRDDIAHTLTTRWSLVGPDGKTHGQLRAVESREGTDKIELLTEDGQLMGRYTFANRVAVGRASIPSLVEVLHRKPGVHDRVDTWTLDTLAPEPDQDPAGIACTVHPKDVPVKDLAL
jgi:hypothetical protein